MPGSSAWSNEKRRESMFTGYRYSVHEGKVYISKLKLFNEFLRPIDVCFPVEFFTTDCIVEKIYDANTGEEIEEIDGSAFFKRKYKKGERITGESIYYCKTRVAVYAFNLFRTITGKIEDIKNNSIACYYAGDPCFPKAKFFVKEIIKTNIDDNGKINEKKMFEELNSYLLTAEKENFPDENRTIAEILHIDSSEKLPPELESLSTEEIEKKKKIHEKAILKSCFQN